MNKPCKDQKRAYESIKNMKKRFGIFYKTCFHIHTPESYDYKLFSDWSKSNYKNKNDKEIYDICIERKVFPNIFAFEDIILEGELSCYKNKKEFFSFLLLADSIIINEIAIVVVSDHNTIDGIHKLSVAIKQICNVRKPTIYPEVFMGVEISCADKNHVVGIFEDNENTMNVIRMWLKENLLSIADGSFQTSLDVLKFIRENSGIGYIAHLNTSDMFKDSAFSGAYKKKLLSDDVLSIVGLSDYNSLETVKNNINIHRSHNSSDIKFVLDNDSHDIESVDKNIFWIKGAKRSFTTLKEAFNDYDISVEFNYQRSTKQYIEGIYVENRDSGFLYDNSSKAFSLSFSNALNCLIGGRGTGKSTVLELIEYVLSQHCDNSKKLDFLCLNGNTWVVYNYNNEEYLIEIRMPVKEYLGDNILRCFGQNPSDRYHFHYTYDEYEIRQYAYRHYLKIYKVISKDDELYLETVSDKADTLKKFFDVRYSVNDLVSTASGDKINEYIYNTIFENRTLSKPQDVIRFKSKNGLKRVLYDVKDVLKKRKEQVEQVLDLFNKSQTNILRIVYSQNGNCSEPKLQEWLFGENYSLKKWYNNYNIRESDLIDYLLSLYDKLGIFEFLTLLSDTDVDRAIKTVKIQSFCTEMNQIMVENGVNSLSEEDIPNVIKQVFTSMIANKNIKLISEYLKKYVSSVEDFSLEFNVNNKEGQQGTLIFKPVGTLSLGQKVVAMLSFVLGYSKYSNDYRPLIIDQPEDNLDNQYIYKNLVRQLRTIKDERQVIIATHNATIVTNAKADQVCVMESDNKHGWIETTGYPGDIQIKKRIINYLEGGEQSFLHKVSIYENALSKYK